MQRSLRSNATRQRKLRCGVAAHLSVDAKSQRGCGKPTLNHVLLHLKNYLVHRPPYFHASDIPPARKYIHSPNSFAACRNGVPSFPPLRFLAAASSRRSSKSSSVAFNSRNTAFARRICLSTSGSGLVFSVAVLIGG